MLFAGPWVVLCGYTINRGAERERRVVTFSYQSFIPACTLSDQALGHDVVVIIVIGRLSQDVTAVRRPGLGKSSRESV